MRARRLSEIARVVAGELRGRDRTATAVSTDSRTPQPGALFVALRGDRVDGHGFVDEAARAGAVGALVDRAGADLPAAGPMIVVDDTQRSLLELAADERDRAGFAVIGVTGSNGKTSTKDLTAAVLSTRYRVHASPASFNNEVGVPITLLSAPESTDLVVAELGARRAGDVAALCRVARPGIVVVTNVGVAHMEVFGSWESIVESGAEPLDALGADGVAVLGIDDPVVRGYAPRSAGEVIGFGLSADATVRAEDLELDSDGIASFTLVMPSGRERVELSVAGEHMVQNALAAAAAGLAMDLSAAECAAGLKGARISRWRMEAFVNRDGVVIVNDAYNANPESVAAALKTTRWMARDGRLCAVLGPMAELGPISLEQHERLGELATRLHVDRLIAVGELARPIAVAAVREGMEEHAVATYIDAADVVADVREWARAGDVVVCKASRVAGLERIAEALR